MDGIRQYLTGITAVAMICGMVRCFQDGKSTAGSLIRFVSGLILVLTVVSPLVKLSLNDHPVISQEIMDDARGISQEGQEMAAQQMLACINQSMEAYILDKAASFGADLSVSFRDFGDDLIPGSVVLRGNISPYAKLQLQQSIASDLGIAKENQLWIG